MKRPAAGLVARAHAGRPARPLTFQVSKAGCDACHQSPHGTQFAQRADRRRARAATAPTPSRRRRVRPRPGYASFKLAGAHAKVPCASCHVSRARRRRQAADGLSPALGQVRDLPWRRARPLVTAAPARAPLVAAGGGPARSGRPRPRRRRPTSIRTAKLEWECSTCHRTEGWTPVRISRRSTTARRASRWSAPTPPRPAGACHVSLDFRGADRNCVACHKDVHQGELGMDCSRCHTPRAASSTARRWCARTGRRGSPSPARTYQRGLRVVPRPDRPGPPHLREPVRRLRAVPPRELTRPRRTRTTRRRFPDRLQPVPFDRDLAPGSVQPREHGLPAHRRAPSRSPACRATATASTRARTRRACRCHQKDYAGATDPNHVTAAFPTDCAQCHTTNGWTGATFDHSTTTFPLTGAHRR